MFFLGLSGCTQRLELCHRFSMLFTLFDFGIENLAVQGFGNGMFHNISMGQGQDEMGGAQGGMDQLTFHVFHL